jgi:hypothetical protein
MRARVERVVRERARLPPKTTPQGQQAWRAFEQALPSMVTGIEAELASKAETLAAYDDESTLNARVKVALQLIQRRQLQEREEREARERALREE